MAAKRSFAERLLVVVNITVANGVAALWIATFLQPGLLGSGLATPVRVLMMPLNTVAAWAAFLGAVALLLWNFAALVRRRDRPQQSNWVLSEGPNGRVRVSREAIEAGLRVAGESLAEITRVRVHLVVIQKRLQVVGQFTCAEGQDHLAGSDRLRAALSQRFFELVRMADGNGVEFQLEFQGFAGKLDKNKAAVPEVVAAEPDTEPEPFRGPQYPIDDSPIDDSNK